MLLNCHSLLELKNVQFLVSTIVHVCSLLYQKAKNIKRWNEKEYTFSFFWGWFFFLPETIYKLQNMWQTEVFLILHQLQWDFFVNFVVNLAIKMYCRGTVWFDHMVLLYVWTFYIEYPSRSAFYLAFTVSQIFLQTYSTIVTIPYIVSVVETKYVIQYICYLRYWRFLLGLHGTDSVSLNLSMFYSAFWWCVFITGKSVIFLTFENTYRRVKSELP